jgi:hypothetical protein
MVGQFDGDSPALKAEERGKRKEKRGDPARERRKPVRCWFSGKKVHPGIKRKVAGQKLEY